MSELSPERLFQVLANVELVTCVYISSSMLLIYDHALTFSREVNLVWRKTHSPFTLLFLVNRYLPYLDNTTSFVHGYIPKPTLSLCAKLVHVQLWSICAGIVIADIILLVRTIAIWRGDRRIGSGVTILLATSTAVAMYSANNYLIVFPNFLSKYPSCIGETITSNSNIHLVTSYATLLGFEAAVLLLTLMRARKYQTGKLFRRLYIDGITFFLYLCVISIINMVAMIITVLELNLILIMVHRNLHSILTGRIILNIRSVGASPTVSDDHPLSVIRASGHSAPSRFTGLTDIYSTDITDEVEGDPFQS